MADCTVNIVLINPLENTVKFGNPFSCLFQFFFLPLYCLFRFRKSLLIYDFLKALYIINEHSRYIKNSLPDKQFQGFFSNKMCGASTRIALVIRADIMLLFWREAVCCAEIQLFSAVCTIE